MPRKVAKKCCTSEELDGSTMVSRLLEVSHLCGWNEKSSEFLETLTCLKVSRQSEDALEIWKKHPTWSENGEYVAVSYCWKPTPALESDSAGKYSIIDPQGRNLRRSRARDSVLTRVTRYAGCKGVSRIWIDRECIPQVDCEEKRVALDSMDLVYSRSRYPLGLLAVSIQTQGEANILQDLLAGRFSHRSSTEDHPILTRPKRHMRLAVVFDLLQRLYRDRWWTRAWIFQEEYLSSTNMHLLVRCRPGIVLQREFGIVQGEICFEAAKFREEATLFLLAFKQGSAPAVYRKCAKMLKRFGKYNVLYHHQRDAQRKAMSPRIVADIQRRALENDHDRLPIIANSCNYGIRLSPGSLANGGYSFGLCLLALYLCNGELLRRARDIKKLPTEMDVCNYLQYISFNKFDPPVEAKHLSYLKECRLHPVSLSRRGLLTNGFLWRIECIIHTHLWPVPPRCSRKPPGEGLNDFQRDCLHQLLENLRARYRHWKIAAKALGGYLDNDAHLRDCPPPKQHMDLMADVVVEAIRTGLPIYVAHMDHSATASAFFVGLNDSSLGVFTSWRAGVDDDGRHRETHVSVGVEVWEDGDGILLETAQWVNGLTIFNQREKVSVVFGWPHAWMHT